MDPSFILLNIFYTFILFYQIGTLSVINDNLVELKKTYWNNLVKPLKTEFSDIMQISSGKRPPVKNDEKSVDTPIPIVGASKVMGWTSRALTSDSIITTGRVGTHGVIQRFNKPVWISDNSFILKSKFEETVYQVLTSQIDFKGLNRGSTQPLITQTDLKYCEIVIPTNLDIEKFESFASKLTKKQLELEVENEKLIIIRDILLPKLLSGEIELN